MGRIYIAKNVINGKGYIGQTIRAIEARLKEHEKGQSKGCSAFHGAIQKYGWTNFEIDCYECHDEDLNKHEKWMINLMGTLSPDGYNLREGGGARGKLSEETKQKLKKPKSNKHKQKLSGENNHNYGKTPSDETKQKNREAHLGKNNPMFGRTGENNSTSKRVYQYDLDGIFIDSFGSTKEAGRHLEKSGKNISECANGSRKRKTAYKFKWAYELTIFM